MTTHNPEVCGRNGHYVTRPCTAQELLDQIYTWQAQEQNGLNHPEDAWEVIEACKQYLEWYNGSNQP